ncbi:hypothetical protein ABQ013_20490, partial [Xanthomonas citri pv. malvacearum]|nr:hypothetical protein [Xanthomonas citri]
MIPQLIHLTAPTKQLLWEERRICDRLQRLLPGWTCYVWDDADNSQLMRRAFPEFAKRYEQIRFGVMKADMGSTPFSRTLTRRPIKAMRSVHVKAQ